MSLVIADVYQTFTEHRIAITLSANGESENVIVDNMLNWLLETFENVELTKEEVANAWTLLHHKYNQSITEDLLLEIPIGTIPMVVARYLLGYQKVHIVVQTCPHWRAFCNRYNTFVPTWRP